MWFFGLIIYSFVCGFLSSLVGGAKGYPTKHWFWIGFWTGILGLIAATGMPIVPEKIESIEKANPTYTYTVK